MGASTVGVGLLPTYAVDRLRWRRSCSSSLRLLQGLALGGEYGGAATYVAEHAPHGKRGCDTRVDPDHRDPRPVHVAPDHRHLPRRRWPRRRSSDWGWRIPFLVSIILLAFSVYIRLKLQRVARLPGDEGRGQGLEGAPDRTPSPSGRTLKIVLLALFGATAGQGVVWYTGQFYALFFLTHLPQGRLPDGLHR